MKKEEQKQINKISNDPFTHQSLVQVQEVEWEGQKVLAVDGKELHRFLEVGKDFSTWIKDRIKEYDFQEKQDYILLPKFGEQDWGGHNRKKSQAEVFPKFGENPKIEEPLLAKFGEQDWGGHNRKEYQLTLEMAKELSMVERNEKGRAARKYFIECEKKLMASRQELPELDHPSRFTPVMEKLFSSFEDEEDQEPDELTPLIRAAKKGRELAESLGVPKGQVHLVVNAFVRRTTGKDALESLGFKASLPKGLQPVKPTEEADQFLNLLDELVQTGQVPNYAKPGSGKIAVRMALVWEPLQKKGHSYGPEIYQDLKIHPRFIASSWAVKIGKTQKTARCWFFEQAKGEK
ncbi:MAG: hypothetical protein A2600_14080 [Candidatus Lambdaproteobacteria bacterium RIFOXYD1_FULL_56_27]|uniref:AntA/AntB antirepressor domain-containing protein n=1 Tax=Candidatus Lambdaproteobacteria bacterium RIFOXYD2_FULL_56_26 TaxID=1817773 RepID=A0A1F6H163_9PROT|nr:MAG: hypothetical protein A2557_14115 [Candidatus Lambdaproteobacteria bacterium RIFOXYD2_FULL_56_26]OGH08265.1 MAG: hypothetical protein A2600_14080 [Candidatus Lambdaproteobacteria bacterium RIFOXYD1_FULL_56_27]